jgi:hypothetical protein
MSKWVRSLFVSLKLRERLIFIGAFITLVIFRIWLIAGIPKLFIYGPHDDLFFAKAAHYIIHGQWLGPYTQMTLIKGPFYSFFLIVSFLAGLPLILSETIFYIAACLVLFFAFSPLIKNHWWRLLLFTLLCYCPASLATGWNLRVYREFVYFSLTLYVVAFSIGLFLRLDEKIPRLLLWSIGLGLSMGAFMITREEGVWIYPILFFLLVSCIVFFWMKKTDKKWGRSMIVLLPIILWYLPAIIVSSLNFSHYGFWGISEQLDPDFNRVLNTIARIKSSTWYPFIQITEEARLKAYEVSPLLNELKDPIERAVIAWQQWDDQATNLQPEWYLQKYTNGGREIGNGHFLWILRDVVFNAGFYATGKYPHEFYKQLADQLEAACDNRKLDCSPPKPIPFIGSIDRRHYPIIARMFFEGVIHLLNQDYIGIQSLDIYSWPEYNDEFKYFEEFVYNPIDSQGIGSDENAQYLVNGNTDLRLKILSYKEEIMGKIVNIYKEFTLPAFVIGFIAWALLIFLSISNKRIGSQEQYLVISIFMLGLFFSRLMTLAIFDATTSVPGISIYGASNYLYIYIFSFLLIYWVIVQKDCSTEKGKYSVSTKLINRIDTSRVRQFVFSSLVFIIAAFLIFINIEMPLAGEDYDLQPWGYHSAPITFLEKANVISHEVIDHALKWNPRIGEALMIITGAFPKVIFDIINTLLFIWLIFILFVIGFGRFPNWKKPSDGFTVFSIFFLIITLCPLFGSIFVWKAGTCNHTWGSIFLLSLILPFRLNYSNRIRIKSLMILFLFILLGFFAGLSVENSSVVVLGFLLIYFIISIKQKRVDKKFIYPLISFAVGLSILLFSPGTTIRRNYYNSLGFDGNLSGIAMYFNRLLRISGDFFRLSWPLLVVFLVCMIIYFVIKRLENSIKTNIRQKEKPDILSIPEILSMFFISSLTVLVLISTSYQSDQQRAFEFFWLILISLSAYLMAEIWIRLSSKYVHLLLIILLLGVLISQMFNMGMVYKQFHAENNTRMGIIYSALENGEREITLPAITIQDSRIIETREILSDLGQRIANYYRFDLVEIQK